jgi:exodeoxyribonuclease-5
MSDSGAICGWEKQKELEYDLIVVDEASMISDEILDDLLSYNIPILCVGDHGQLPPVGEDVGIMMSPDLKLETVRRQALDNPIIALSQLVRQGGDWQRFVKTSSDPRVRYLDAMDVTFEVMGSFRGFQERPIADDPLVLCGMNKTRALLNKAARATLKAEATNVVVKGERVVCLRNQYLSGVLVANGFRGKVLGTSHASNPAHINAKIQFPDEGIEMHDGLLCKAQFGVDKTFKTFVEVSPQYRSWMEAGILMDYGYALTVHKAQGSQAERVICQVERMGTADDFKRWLYTAATRASKELVLSF